MGLLNNIKDRFKNAEFSVAPNKKLKTISKDFKEAEILLSLSMTLPSSVHAEIGRAHV